MRIFYHKLVINGEVKLRLPSNGVDILPSAQHCRTAVRMRALSQEHAAPAHTPQHVTTHDKVHLITKDTRSYIHTQQQKCELDSLCCGDMQKLITY